MDKASRDLTQPQDYRDSGQLHKVSYVEMVVMLFWWKCATIMYENHIKELRLRMWAFRIIVQVTYCPAGTQQRKVNRHIVYITPNNHSTIFPILNTHNKSTKKNKLHLLDVNLCKISWSWSTSIHDVRWLTGITCNPPIWYCSGRCSLVCLVGWENMLFFVVLFDVFVDEKRIRATTLYSSLFASWFLNNAQTENNTTSKSKSMDDDQTIRSRCGENQ